MGKALDPGRLLLAALSIQCLLAHRSAAAGTWREVALPELGEVSVLAGDSRALYAGTASGNGVGSVYRSLDEGLSWERMHQGFVPVRALVPAGTYIYLGTGRTHHLPSDHALSQCPEFPIFEPCRRDPTQEGGLYFTQNGANWIPVPMNAPVDPSPRFYSIGAMTVRRMMLYAGSPRGIVSMRVDSPAWWQLAHSDSLPARSPRFGRNSVFAMDATDSLLFALTDSALYSAPLGTTVPPSWREEPMRAKALAHLGNVLVVAGEDGLLRTRDGGAAWERLGGGAFHVLHASGSHLYGARGREILRSGDTGKTWIPAAPEAPAPAACLLLRGGTLFAGFAGVTGVFRASSPASQWQASVRGFRDAIPYAPFFAGARLGAILRGHGAVFLDPAGGRWSLPAGIGTLQHVAATRAALYAAGNDSLWAVDPAGGPAKLLRTFAGDPVSGLAVSGDALIVARSHRLFRCPLGAGDCVESAPGLIPPFPTNANGLTVSTFRGLHSLQEAVYALYERLYRSADGGATWEDAGAIDPAPSVLRSVPGALLLCRTEYSPQLASRLLCRLSADGRQWRDLPPLEEAASFYGAAGTAGDLLLIADGAVFRLREGAAAWTRLDSGPVGAISAIATEGANLAALSSDHRLFVRELEGVGVRPSSSGRAIRGPTPAPGLRWRVDGRRLPGGPPGG